LGLDGDESMAMGAVFRAANLSTQFQVRKFGMIDVTPFPVGVRLANLPSKTFSHFTWDQYYIYIYGVDADDIK
jgi:molecular chaperone DnaK (HSP70)